ncbi:MAG TPA: phage portal protein [Clostridia bacterium]|nr:phage portal protein [Clostridia bacterium]
MIFKFRNTSAPEQSIGLQSLASWLGLDGDELNIKGEKALKEITAYTCIKILAETLGKLPLKIYRGREGKAADHYLYPLLKLRPNPYMSAFAMWSTTEVRRNVHGNAYIWIDCGRDGKVRGLYPLPSEKVQILVDDTGLISCRSKLWYIFSDNSGVQHKIKPDEIMHFTGISTDGIRGLSPIEALQTQIETAKAAENYLNRSLQNGLTTSGIVQYVGELSEEKQKTFREAFERMSSGLKNVNRISLMPIGYKYEPIALKLTDAQFLENAKLTIQQLTAAFGVKPHQVNLLEKTSYASQAEANREFYVDTLMAILTMYEQEITYKVLTGTELAEQYYVKYNPDVILRGDPKTRYEAYARAVQNGIKTPNECRAMEEDEPIEGADRLFLNGNMVPIEHAGIAYMKGGENA